MEPHVALKFKRVFPQVYSGARDALYLSNTDTNCRDLEWFLERYPVSFDPPELVGELDSQARLFDTRVESALSIISGTRKPSTVQMALPPRQYQLQAADLCRLMRGLLVADELGLGKTVSGITLAEGIDARPAIVVVQSHLQTQWRDEILRFIPGLTVHIAKKSNPEYIAPLFDSWPPDVLIITYRKLSGWADHLCRGDFRSIVFDEIQELRRSESEKYLAAQTIATATQFQMGLSATPIYNYGIEFWNVLNILRPGALGSKAEFIQEWCSHSAEERKARIKDPKAFGTFARENFLMIRRTRAEVGRELPPLTNVVHEFEPDPEALQAIETRATELARVLLGAGAGIEKMQAAEELSNALRQATGISKAKYVAEFTRMLLDSGEPVILFGWHRAVYEIWAEEFADLNPAWYTGSESPKEKDEAKRRFCARETGLIIVSLRSGSGLDGLQKVCCRGVIGEYDWSPGVLEQCIGRFYRDGQEEASIAYFPTATTGSDPIMLDVLGIKRGQIERVRDPNAAIAIPKQTDPNHIRRLAEFYLQNKGAKAQ